jgi:hypothetical protein
MDNRKDCSTASDMTVENVECCEAPTGKPQKDIVPASKHPEPRQGGVADNASAVRDVAPGLLRFRIAKLGVSRCPELFFKRCLELTKGSARRYNS